MKASKRFTANGFGDTHSTAGFKALTLGSIGRFTLREAVVASGTTGSAAGPQVVLGVLSLILWALIVVVTLNTS